MYESRKMEMLRQSLKSCSTSHKLRQEGDTLHEEWRLTVRIMVEIMEVKRYQKTTIGRLVSSLTIFLYKWNLKRMESKASRLLETDGLGRE